MNKIKNLKIKGNILKYLGHGCTLTGAGWVGTSITMGICTDQSIFIPVMIALFCAAESSLLYGLSKLYYIDSCDNSKENNDYIEPKVFIKQ